MKEITWLGVDIAIRYDDDLPRERWKHYICNEESTDEFLNRVVKDIKKELGVLGLDRQTLRPELLNAVEYGYRLCKKGNNLQQAISQFEHEYHPKKG